MIVAKKKAVGPSVDELVQQALVTLATAEGPVRLTGKGDPPALFANAIGANKEPVARLLDTNTPLVAATGPEKNAPLRLTLTGLKQVLPHLPPEKVGVAAKPVAASLPAVERAIFLNEMVSQSPAAAGELLPLYEEAVAAEKAAAEARATAAAKQREQEEAIQAAIRRWLDLSTQRKKQRVDALLQALEAEGAEAPTPIVVVAQQPAPQSEVPHRPTLPVLHPETEEDRTFRRQMARRLVSAWIDGWDEKKTEARQLLETAIWNVTGFRQIGEAGQQVTFDGTQHEGPAGMFPGDQARVIRPGWALEEEDREIIIAKAVVGT